MIDKKETLPCPSCDGEATLHDNDLIEARREVEYWKKGFEETWQELQQLKIDIITTDLKIKEMETNNDT